MKNIFSIISYSYAYYDNYDESEVAVVVIPQTCKKYKKGKKEKI